MNTEKCNNQKCTNAYRASFFSLIIMIILLGVAVACHLFGWRDAPFQFLAACLGAGVTVIITNILLVEQTKQQDTLQKNRAATEEELQNKAKQMELEQIIETERYKTKLRIYQEYLERLCDVVRDRELTTDEKIDMQFRTAYLAMHSDVGHIEKVSSSIKDIIGSLIDPSGDKYDVEKVQRALFNIVHQFRAELYPNKGDTEDGNVFDATINNFVAAFSPEGDDGHQPDISIGGNLTLWNTAVEKWQESNEWDIITDGETIRLHRVNQPEIHVLFGFWENHYYIQAKYYRFVNFSQALKWKYKGRRTYETWWKHIEDNSFYCLSSGEFWEKFSSDTNMQSILIEWFDKLIKEITDFDIPANRWDELMRHIDRKECEHNGWEFWIYNANCIVCDSHLSAIGNPFIDTYNDNGKIVVRLGNRDKNIEMQKKIVANLGMPTDGITKNDTRTEYASFDDGTSDEIVMSKVAELIARVSKM